MASAYSIHIRKDSCWTKIEVYSKCLDNLRLCRKVGSLVTQEPTQLWSAQTKLFSVEQVGRTFEGEIRTLVSNVITEDVAPPHPTPSHKIHHSCCNVN